jgi:hypothetical protein
MKFKKHVANKDSIWIDFDLNISEIMDINFIEKDKVSVRFEVKKEKLFDLKRAISGLDDIITDYEEFLNEV